MEPKKVKKYKIISVLFIGPHLVSKYILSVPLQFPLSGSNVVYKRTDARGMLLEQEATILTKWKLDRENIINISFPSIVDQSIDLTLARIRRNTNPDEISHYISKYKTDESPTIKEVRAKKRLNKKKNKRNAELRRARRVAKTITVKPKYIDKKICVQEPGDSGIVRRIWTSEALTDTYKGWRIVNKSAWKHYRAVQTKELNKGTSGDTSNIEINRFFKMKESLITNDMARLNTIRTCAKNRLLRKQKHRSKNSLKRKRVLNNNWINTYHDKKNKAGNSRRRYYK